MPHHNDTLGRVRHDRKRPFTTLLMSAGLLSFSASAANATTQDAFDLLCKSKQGQSFHFRFDLQQRKWCFENCQSVWGIDELADARIKLSLRTKDDADYWTIHIDRYTSDFWIVRRGYGNEPQEWGKCVSQAFSGFPQRRF